MNNKITIVTAFFSLNRESWEGFNRSDEKYINYFKFWAGLKNDLIIYTDAYHASYLKNIREEYGNFNTELVILDDWKDYDVPLYDSIKKVLDFEFVKDFRIYPNNPECWNPDYDYLMLIKEWCVQDAVNRKIATGMIAWVDFGFNHGGDLYTNSNEFNFIWDYNFTDKIHLFSVNDLDSLPIFEISRRLSTYIQGDIIVAPDFLWIILWKLVRENMISLNKAGLIDDDQTILLMSYREKPELFEIHKSTWFSIFRDCGHPNLSIREISNPPKTFKSKYGFWKLCLKYSYKWFKIIYKGGIKS